MHATEGLPELIHALRSDDGRIREHARNALVILGGDAVDALIGLLTDADEHVRWEACKTLGSIADPRAAAPLVGALRDESFEIQWLAAEGLIAMGPRAVVPLLSALETDFRSVYLRQGAHHILHALERDGRLDAESVAVLDSLRFLRPHVSVAIAARKALDKLHSHHIARERVVGETTADEQAEPQ